jgi:hypothetical protein
MENKIYQHAAMNQLEEILKKLSRRGLIDYLTQSCGLIYSAGWEICDRQHLINTILVSDYGQEAYESYRSAQ